MGDPEQSEAATTTQIGGINFLSPPTAVPSSRRHLLLDDTAVRRPFNKTETTAKGNKTQDGQDQDPEDTEQPAAVAATQKERSPLTLKVLLEKQTRQDREMAAMRAASERQGAQIQQMLTLLQAQAANASEQNFSTDYRLPIPNSAPTTEPTTATNTAPTTAPNTEPITEPTTEHLTELARMGVLPDTEHEQMHTEHIPKTSLFTELENINVLSYTDYHQHSNSDQRRTVDHYSLYLWCKDHDQGHMIQQIEQLYTENLTATAYKARIVSILAGLHNFSNPTRHTRLMLILRALIFSADPTTQTRSARMLKAYLATPNDQLTALRDHVTKHGSPPAVEGMDSIVGVVDTPGLARLAAAENPEYYEACLKNVFDMVIEVNARAHTQGLGTADAMRIYDETRPGVNYADTSVREDNAWTLLCRGFGTSKPKTDYDRLEFLLRLCGQYQRTDKTKRKLIQQLRAIGKTLMNVPFAEAAAMIEAIASSHDEVEAQMGQGQVAAGVTVNTVTGTGLAKPCSICSKPGHAARDCMVFMKRMGTCGHWFMHSIGRYQTGCRYGDSCKLAHKRPEVEPEEDANQVKVAATTGAALEEKDKAEAM